jgi:nicotinate-nucleotide adenylyltransferase
MTGVFGGSFDPPHLGHLALAEAGLDQLGLDGLLVLVVADPGHKRVATPAETRLELTRLAFADDPRVSVEIEDRARTIDTLQARTLDDPVLILGGDELVDFATWKDHERVLDLARLAVAMRPGVPDAHVREAHARLPAPDRITFFGVEPIPVSSTLVRERVARGEPVDDLVPPAVAEAIRRLGLYVRPE